MIRIRRDQNALISLASITFAGLIGAGAMTGRLEFIYAAAAFVAGILLGMRIMRR